MRQSKKHISFFIFSFFIFLFCFDIYSQNLSSANRRTAIRYLLLAQQYAGEKKWDEANNNSTLGLAYDDSVADLWYIKAVSNLYLGESKSKVIPLIVKSLTECEWVDYNKENARVLYADLLCSTRSFEQALVVLDQKPFIYSADAEYIRIKSYYNSNQINKAREKIDAARRIYPDDDRFAEIFFRYEYALGGRNSENSKIADSFILNLSQYKNVKTDLEIYSALFSEGERKIRLLKSFNARSLKSPLYAIEALKNGLLDEHKALDYFYQFADKSIDYSILIDFASLLKTEESKIEFGKYLNSYNGTIYFDTDGDLTYNLVVQYNRGRPKNIIYDENQDDENEWSADCDFGVPLIVHLTEGGVDIEYGNWPLIQKAVYKLENNTFDLTFNLVSEVLSWTPFSIIADKELSSLFGIEFFIPTLLDSTSVVSGDELIKAASSYVIPTQERKNSYIKVSMLDGVPQIARYFENEIMYAQSYFENGLPTFRTVDMDGDGIFETTEKYGYFSDRVQNVISEKDEKQIMTNLFGLPTSGTGLYVKMIQIDQNGDTVPDFTEEYLEGEGKVSSWDLDNDGKWDICYKKIPNQDGNGFTEQSLFHQPFTNEEVIIFHENGQPVKVKNKNKILPVIKAATKDIYWLGKVGLRDDNDKVLKFVNQNTDQGVSTIVDSNNRSIIAVRIGKYIFAQILESNENNESN